MFKRVDAVRPGQEAALTAETLLLLGGSGSTAPQPGHSSVATILFGDHADVLLPYCSGTGANAKEVPGLVSLPVPDALQVGPVYGLAVLLKRAKAMRLVLFMLSERGQAILARGGLAPVAPGR